MNATTSGIWLRGAETVLHNIITAGALDGSIVVRAEVRAQAQDIRIHLHGFEDAQGLARALGLDSHTTEWVGPGGTSVNLGNAHTWSGEVEGVRVELLAHDFAAEAVAA